MDRRCTEELCCADITTVRSLACCKRDEAKANDEDTHNGRVSKVAPLAAIPQESCSVGKCKQRRLTDFLPAHAHPHRRRILSTHDTRLTSMLHIALDTHMHPCPHSPRAYTSLGNISAAAIRGE